jgi:hypothetical protein
MVELLSPSLYSLLAEPASDGPSGKTRGQTSITESKETLDSDGEERDQWLLTLGH